LPLSPTVFAGYNLLLRPSFKNWVYFAQFLQALFSVILK
jgi:hypothetical protein